MIEIIPNWHPVLVHFPIVFATAAVFFVAMGLLFKLKPWATQCLMFGRWMLWAAAIFACVAAVFGWFAYNSVDHDDAGHLAMTLHRNWALVSLSALVVLAGIDFWPGRTVASPSYGFLTLLIAAWLLVISTAWHGGEVVFRHGLGVMSMPKPESAGHAHDHGDDHGEMPMQVEDPLHQDDHAPSHDDTANGEHPHDAVPVLKIPAVDAKGAKPGKAGHNHAPGAPPHQD